MREPAPIQQPRIPLGRDQQGRHPEAAAAATEIGADDAIDELDRAAGYVMSACMVAVVLMAALAAFWPSV